MKAYKGFRKDDDGRMYCQPSSSEDKFYYEEGKTYELPEGEEPELCHTGFHACTLPMDVFSYYNSSVGNVEFHEVELEGVSIERSYDSKFAGRKITIGRKITPDEMSEISIRMILDGKDKYKYFIDSAYAIVKKDVKQNYFTTDGTIISDTWFDVCYDVKNGFARVIIYDDADSPKHNFVNTGGKLLSDKWYDWCDVYFSEGLAAVRDGEKYNYIRTDGTILSDTWFDGCYSFRLSKGKVKNGEKFNFINKDGKILSDEWFDCIRGFYNGFSCVIIYDDAGNQKYNYIDADCKLLSEEWFDYADDFLGGFGTIGCSGKYNFIGKDGKILSDTWFDDAQPFYEETADVKINGKWATIDKEGKINEQ